MVLTDPGGHPVDGVNNWNNGFLPPLFQGTVLRPKEPRILDLDPPPHLKGALQSQNLDLLQTLNRRHLAERPGEADLEARIASYELAAQMQTAAREALDVSQETAATQALYGLDQKETATYGRMCLLARRMVERGVRFVQLYHGAGSKWDAHAKIETNHGTNCLSMDRCVAGLLQDLKQRGLLDETLVVWGGEFGRTPMSEQGDGRDHNPTGFTMWMAGGGVRGGQTLGTTDELGLHAVEDRLHVQDIHASILHLLGIDNMALTWMHQGRPERPTINEGAFFKRLVG
jgi:uncharacterized protein (DUF1501 family)